MERTEKRVITLPNNKTGETQIYRNAKFGELMEWINPNIKTLYSSFKNAETQYPNNKCLGCRVGDGPYQWMSYQTAGRRAKHLGSALLSLGLKAHIDKVGIYSVNRPEWILTELACHSYSLTLIPLYDTLGADALSYIIEHTELKISLVTQDKINAILKSTQSKTLKYIIQIGGTLENRHVALCEEHGIQLLLLEDFEKQGMNNIQEFSPPQPDELSTICYSSGTTGRPKGVMLTHANIIAQLAAVMSMGINPVTTDIHISYLPLAHVFERMICNAMLSRGAAIGFYRGDITKLFDDIRDLKATIFPSVPRIWNRLYEKINQTIANVGGMQKILFDLAYETKKEALTEGYITHSLWDTIIFNSIKDKLGGRIRVMITASAPISERVMEFLRICFSCPVLEGYGLTEVSSAATITLMTDTECGNVGVPAPCLEMKLIDAPEMNYLTTDKPPRGEICLRGPSRTPGYYKDKELTEATIDKEGWLRTGDIGCLLESGNLKIIDRRKNMFKLSQGEFVAPENLEAIFTQSPFVSQIFVYGDPLKSSLVGIVNPNEEYLKQWAIDHKKSNTDIIELSKDPLVIKTIIENLIEVGKENKLRGFEFLKSIYIHPEPFSEENGLLTPTLKVKRNNATKLFQRNIDELYHSLSEHHG